MSNFDSNITYPSLPPWVRPCLNQNWQEDLTTIFERGNNPDVFPHWMIQSYYPICVGRVELLRVGTEDIEPKFKVTECMGHDLHRFPNEAEHLERESIGYEIWQEKIRIARGPPPTLSGISEEEYGNLFRYVYLNLKQKQDSSGTIKLYLDGDKSNTSPGNVKEIHIADGITVFHEAHNDDSCGYIELFDDLFHPQPIIVEFLKYASCMIWYCFGLTENTSPHPVKYRPCQCQMPNAHVWFNCRSYKRVQIAKCMKKGEEYFIIDLFTLTNYRNGQVTLPELIRNGTISGDMMFMDFDEM